MACLDDEAVLGLVEGRLAAVALDAAEAHLDTCDRCRDVVAQMSRATAPSSALERGRQIGKYVVGDLLGSGAMGRVYSAWQPELDRRVAIKVLREDAASSGGRERMVKEAQAMARLDHPNVVGVFEVGELDDDAVYVVMDLVEGDTLRGWAERPRPWRETVRVLADVARGLAAVHAAGVIHRDIKPDNIVVGTDGRARLADFGLARGAGTKSRAGSRIADAASFEDTVAATPVSATTNTVAVDKSASGSGARTVPVGGIASAGAARADMRAFPAATPSVGAIGASGTSIAGTPVYMAAEVLRGNSATAASDQFAFGVTAYEILAGKRPFSGDTWAELAKAIERSEVATLAGAPGWLDAAIRRCLAVDPAKRFPSMTAVADHLADRLQRRRPAVWIAGAVTAAAVASTVTWVGVRGDPKFVDGPTCVAGITEIANVWRPATRSQHAALGEPTLAAIDGWTAKWAGEHDASCTASRTEPIAKVAARERCLVRQRDELAALLDRSSALAQTPNDAGVGRGPGRATNGIVGDDPTNAGGPTNVGIGGIGARFDNSGDTERTLSERMLDALAARSPADCRLAEPGSADPVPADPSRAAGVREVERGLPGVRAAIALGDARPVLPKTIDLVERARRSGHAPTLADALLVRADALRATADLNGAAIAARDALAEAERGHDDQTAARAWIARVTLAGDRRDLVAAEDLAVVAGAAIDRAGGNPRLVAQLLKLRALIAFNRGQFAGATALLVDARARLVKLSGEQSLDVAGIESSLGSTARGAGDLDAAEKHHRAALAIDRALRDARHIDLSRDLHNLAGVQRLRGDLDAAAATYNEALAIAVQARGENSVEAALTRNSLGLVRMARGEWEAARALLAKSRDALTLAQHGDRAFPEHNLGLVAAATGDHRAALDYFDAAAKVYASTIGDRAISPIRLHLDRARSLAALGRADAARSEAKLALDGATREDIPWIVEDARALLEARPVIAQAPKRPDVHTVEPPVGPRPANPVTIVAPPPPNDKPKPKPKRDVGTYGTSQGF